MTEASTIPPLAAHITIHKTQPCVVCGRPTLVAFPTDELRRWHAGAYVQDVWPDFTPEAREWLISGTHPKCWDELFGEEL